LEKLFHSTHSDAGAVIAPAAHGTQKLQFKQGADVEAMLKAQYPDLIQRLKVIPRTVWVLSDQIELEIFQRFLVRMLGIDAKQIHAVQTRPRRTHEPISSAPIRRSSSTRPLARRGSPILFVSLSC
jgi:hypothetical protein